MRRFHSEIPKLMKRWKQELLKHSDKNNHYLGQLNAGGSINLVQRNGQPTTPDMIQTIMGITMIGDCHCFGGVGKVRKIKPFDCGRTRCKTCHYDKYYQKGQNRSYLKRQALRFEALAYENTAKNFEQMWQHLDAENAYEDLDIEKVVS